MSTPRLFVSDLDGTLLKHDSTLSDYAHQQIKKFISQGVLFTIATARSIISARQVLPHDIPFSLPIICSNGAYLADFQTGTRQQVNAIQPAIASHILDHLHQEHFDPFVSSWNGTKDFLMMGAISNKGLAMYRDNRETANDPRLQFVSDVRLSLSNHIISINAIDRKARIFPLAASLRSRFPHAVQVYTYQNWEGEDWYWLSVYDTAATKGRALAQLCASKGVYADECMVFGDNLNDISMFEWAGHPVAVSNAHDSVFAHAKTVIDTSDTDSVVKHILKLTTDSSTSPSLPGI